LEHDPETGLYSFTTSSGIIYVCGFRNITHMLSPMVGIYDLEVFDFEFQPIQDTAVKRSYDERISITVCDLFNRFFSSDLRVLIYVCSSTDARHRERNRLFGLWHRKYVSDRLDRIVVEIKVDQELEICGAALMTHNFPHNDVFRYEVIEKIEGMLIEKMGL